MLFDFRVSLGLESPAKMENFDVDGTECTGTEAQADFDLLSGDLMDGIELSAKTEAMANFY